MSTLKGQSNNEQCAKMARNNPKINWVLHWVNWAQIEQTLAIEKLWTSHLKKRGKYLNKKSSKTMLSDVHKKTL